ncbi:NodT family efflux transporter outer membrane factor (OMF) lipoprotein [Oxalobacteraceae bacterium GrIS 2.11]
MMLAPAKYYWPTLVASTLCLCSCAVGPDFVHPDAPAVDAYVRPAAMQNLAVAQPDQAAIPAQRIRVGATIPDDWWRLFQSEQLNQAVLEALAHNPTLEAAIATLRQSQHNLQAGYGVFFPQVTSGLSGMRERSAPIEQGLHTAPSIFNVVTLSGSISYPLDLFGGERRQVEALLAQSEYQSYVTRAAYLTLSANVVNACIARAAYAAQIRVTEDLIKLEQQQLAATVAQVKAGTSPYSAQLTVRSLIAGSQAAVAQLQQQRSQTENLLATLAGRFPEQATAPEIDLARLVLPTELPLSLPSELVHQRPDILQSEAQLHVASANVGVASAAMYPSISLTGTAGQTGTSLGNLGGENGRFWSIGPSISIPIFRGGSLWYAREAARDAYQAAAANYRQTVLTAFAQVATVLQALEHDAEALTAQTESRSNAQQALHLTQVNYQTGLASYLEVISADVQFHQADIAYIQTVAQRHQDTVALFVALGGGWWNGTAL